MLAVQSGAVAAAVFVAVVAVVAVFVVVVFAVLAATAVVAATASVVVFKCAFVCLHFPTENGHYHSNQRAAGHSNQGATAR